MSRSERSETLVVSACGAPSAALLLAVVAAAADAEDVELKRADINRDADDAGFQERLPVSTGVFVTKRAWIRGDCEATEEIYINQCQSGVRRRDATGDKPIDLSVGMRSISAWLGRPRRQTLLCLSHPAL